MSLHRVLPFCFHGLMGRDALEDYAMHIGIGTRGPRMQCADKLEEKTVLKFNYKHKPNMGFYKASNPAICGRSTNRRSTNDEQQNSTRVTPLKCALAHQYQFQAVQEFKLAMIRPRRKAIALSLIVSECQPARNRATY